MLALAQLTFVKKPSKALRLQLMLGAVSLCRVVFPDSDNGRFLRWRGGGPRSSSTSHSTRFRLASSSHRRTTALGEVRADGASGCRNPVSRFEPSGSLNLPCIAHSSGFLAGSVSGCLYKLKIVSNRNFAPSREDLFAD